MPESQRMQVLRSHGVLDTPPDESFDELARMAAEVLDAPMALVNLIEEERNWFLSRVGVAATHLERRADGICPNCLGAEMLVLRDAAADPRFRDKAVVTGAPHIRFYAGVTLVSREGAALGTLCVFGPTPRVFTPTELRMLKVLGRQVEAQLELKRREHAREALLRLIVEQSTEGIIVADTEGTLRLVNSAAQAQHGMPALEVTPSQWSHTYGLLSLEGKPLSLEETPLYRALRGELVEEARWKVRRPDGSERVLVGTATPLWQTNGRLAGAFVMSRDETERMARDEERTRLHQETRTALVAREDFLTAAAHELRTPLTILSLKLRTLEKSAEACGAAEALAPRLEEVTRQTRRLAAVVEDLFREADARAEVPAPRTVAPPEAERPPVDLTRLVWQVAAREQAACARAQCALTVDAPVPVVGAWNETALEEVLERLLSNALKFGAGRPVSVRVVAEEGHALLRVTDRGPGVPESERARIFERFSRGVPVSNYGGLGLGLHRVRTRVEELGGSVEVESGPGGGASFVVRLPLASRG
jgi:PAS domain S-box-containing protein